ncbi:MAG TPA: methylmalonyl Co-A mutase-associated GTPase MeaB [Sporichthyaceae bacterium]
MKDPDALAAEVRDGSRTAIGRAITLVESTRADHREVAAALLDRLDPYANEARRVGITGMPGVGKSTFIDGFGSFLTQQGHRVAVVAVDPSSARSGGSILGDKTRMARLANDPNAFVRPAPTAGSLGGVTRATRASMTVLAAAGYDVLLVETVGIGQSETAVAEMVDTFLLLTLARTGDQLQGIKKGVLELADVVAVNKADGPHEGDARTAARELAGTMRLLGPDETGWIAPVLTCSGLTDVGLPEVWDALGKHVEHLRRAGALDERHRNQRVEAMWATVRDDLDRRLREHGEVRALATQLEAQVRAGELSPVHAADAVVDRFLHT